MNLVFILSLLSLVSSFFLTWMVRTISQKKKFFDHPNERSSHTIPTPRGGGLAIVIVWFAGISVLFVMGMVSRSLYFALLSGILLAVISFVDDIISIKPAFRLIVQIITVLIAFFFLNGIRPVHLFGVDILPAVILFPVTIVGMIWFINLFNFLDGIDGYASIEAIMISLAVLFFTGESINLILLASVIGFLIWNWPKARIFMGDVGSTQLGFILVVLGINYHNVDKLPIIFWVTLSAPFWFDATLTLFRRWRNKENLSQAHRKHVYQRLVQSGYSHLKVDIYLIMINLAVIIMIFLCRESNILHFLLLLVIVTFLYLVTLYTDKRKPF